MGSSGYYHGAYYYSSKSGKSPKEIEAELKKEERKLKFEEEKLKASVKAMKKDLAESKKDDTEDEEKSTSKTKKSSVAKPKEESKKSEGCYIATCVYGSYDCPQVWVLRRYRDYKLKKTAPGKLFVKIYYFISPTIVKIFGKKKWFNKFWISILNKKVKKCKAQGFEDTKYND